MTIAILDTDEENPLWKCPFETWAAGAFSKLSIAIGKPFHTCGLNTIYLPPATKLGQGYIFCPQGRVPGPRGLGPRGVPGPGGWGVCAWSWGAAWWRPPPRDSHCCGRYTSYWNTFLSRDVHKTNYDKSSIS